MKPLTAEEIAELRAESDRLNRTPPSMFHYGANLLRLARPALPRLLDEVERSRALLKFLEWGGGGGGVTDGCCPNCGQYKEHGGHDPGCGLAAIIAGLPPPQPPELVRARALLKRIEWGGTDSRMDCSICPDCGADAPGTNIAGEPMAGIHAEGCDLAALLGEGK